MFIKTGITILMVGIQVNTSDQGNTIFCLTLFFRFVVKTLLSETFFNRNLEEEAGVVLYFSYCQQKPLMCYFVLVHSVSY